MIFWDPCQRVTTNPQLKIGPFKLLRPQRDGNRLEHRRKLLSIDGLKGELDARGAKAEGQAKQVVNVAEDAQDEAEADNAAAAVDLL